MHATKLITPGIWLMLIVGMIAFMLIFRFIFKKK